MSSSSNSPPNYTEGVPVKISEKYKPPPEIHLTTRLVQQLSRTQIPVAFEDYNFDLERKIMSKTTEWINYRLKEKTDRQERIHQRELARQKRLEEEQKVKLNQVSYPSTDELTSSCDEDEENINEATTKHVNFHQEQQQTSIPSEKLFSENFNSNSILMPTQATLMTATNTVSGKKSHRRYASNSSNKIDFSFFESDASPFDHLEMKSMNEMEELSKILKSTAVDVDDNNALERNNSSESESSEKNAVENNNNNNVDSLIKKNSIEPLDQSQDTKASYLMKNHQQYHQPQQVYNNYYSYGAGNNPLAYQYSGATATINNQKFTHSIVNQQQQHLPNNCYYTPNYAVNYLVGHSNHLHTDNNNTAFEDFSDKIEVAKSKSVPDIIKELNDELNNSERRRIRNNSQNSQVVKEFDEDEGANSAPSPNKDDEFNKLSPKSQAIARQISQMGFNQSLVVRVLNRIGDNNKKIVEHLISLSELLQMGFDENLVSEALIKFDNNKDQALDFLIS